MIRCVQGHCALPTGCQVLAKDCPNDWNSAGVKRPGKSRESAGMAAGMAREPEPKPK